MLPSRLKACIIKHRKLEMGGMLGWVYVCGSKPKGCSRLKRGAVIFVFMYLLLKIADYYSSSNNQTAGRVKRGKDLRVRDLRGRF